MRIAGLLSVGALCAANVAGGQEETLAPPPNMKGRVYSAMVHQLTGVALDGEGKEQKQAQQPAYPAESAGMPLMAMSTAEQLAFAAEYAALLVGLWLAWSVLCILAGSAFAGYTAGELAAGFLLFATAVDGAIFLAF